MAKSIVIPLTSLVTIDGTENVFIADVITAGLWLRRFSDAGVYIDQFVGVSLGSGQWQFDVPEGNYQLWKSAYPDATASNRLDKWHGGAAKYRRIQDEEDPKYLLLTGGQLSGNLDLNDAGFLISPKDPTSGTHVGDRDYNDVRYIAGSQAKHFWWLTANKLIVDGILSGDEAGYYYKTIQGAIDYAQTQTPSATNRFVIFIMPNKLRASGYSENLTIQPYVDLIGLGMVLVQGNISGGNVNTRLENIIAFYEGNFTLADISVQNCVFTAMQTNSGSASRVLTLSGLRSKDCGYYSVGGNTTPTIVSNGSNKFFGANDFNCPVEKHSTDIGNIHSFDDPTVAYTY